MAGFGLIIAAGLVEPLWNVPGTTAAGSEINRYLAEHRNGFIGALTVYAFGMTLFLVFAAGLSSWLRAGGRADDALCTAFLAGSTALATLVFAGFVPMLVLAYRAPDTTAPRELYDASFGLLALSGAPTAVALGAFAAIVFRSKALPRVTAWLALVGAVAHVAIVCSFVTRSGFFSLEGGVIVAIPLTLFLWLLATATTLALASRSSP
jgi:hypothetical protein